MKFVKMHGTGNDFIIMDCLEKPAPENPGALASELCNRHFSIGADGIVLIKPSYKGHFFMDIWNADGSQAGMCGNATRCTAKYLFDEGLLSSPEFSLDTGDGIKRVRLNLNGSDIRDITVNLGSPRWEPSAIPVIADTNSVIDFPLLINDQSFMINAVSMGNPHCVIFTDRLDDAFINTWGPRLETHSLFPDRINVEFTSITGENKVSVRVWERGCGETMACGTGAAAVCSVLHRKGMLTGPLECSMRGGTLMMEYIEGPEAGYILKTGPAVKVFEGWIKREGTDE